MRVGGHFFKEGESCEFNGKIICENCYMYETSPPKTCDLLAVSAALSIWKQLGQSGIAGLTELHERIYSGIEKKIKITKEELLLTVNFKPED